MIERHFVLNLDRINGARNAEHPGKKQEIIKGKAFMHFYEQGAEEPPGSLNNMLVLAIERSYLQELYLQMMNEHADPGDNPIDIEHTQVIGTESLYGYLEDDYYDPDHAYAAIMVVSRNL